MRLARLLPLFAALLLVCCFSAQAQQPPVLTLEDEQAVHIRPARPASSVPLASGTLRSAVELLERGQGLGPVIDVVDSKIRVEVMHDLESAEIRALITDLGGTVEGEVEDVLVQALMPFDQLVALESHAGVQFVRPPLEANVPLLPPSNEMAAVQSGSPIVGEEVAKTNADAWHAAGYTGTGVKVGIVDYFDGTLWSNAVAAGELPTAAGTFCQVDGTSCDIWTVAAGAEHGQAVAEVIHEMAPGAQLYLATVDTVSDLQDAVDYFDTQGVDIISRSLSAQYDGPGDGTGPIDTVLDSAVADGMVWFNSAGNRAGYGTKYGEYWRDDWVDSDADTFIEFAPGDELMVFWCRTGLGLRWSDFGAGNPTDYDVLIFDNPDDTDPIAWSTDDQTAGAPPLELDIECRSDPPDDIEIDYLAIHLWDAGNGTSGDILEFLVHTGELQYWQNPYSAAIPASDTASPGGLSVGAVDPPLGTDIAGYSSQGPTNDGLYGGTDRIKPDISAAAGVASYTLGTFAGTSASTPAVAGAAALIIEAGLASTPAEVKTYLLNNATVDRGAAGPDNAFGEGELLLGSPPPVDSGVTERVSVDSAGNQGNHSSTSPSISADGRYVAFSSSASNLVAGDTNGDKDIFVHDRQTGVTERVSVDSAGNQGNDYSYGPSISADGRYVAFTSYAALVSVDTNNWCDRNGDGVFNENCSDVYVHDRQTGATERVSVDSSGSQAIDASSGGGISADGRFVAFSSDAPNLVAGDTNYFCGLTGGTNCADVFVHDRETDITERVSVDSAGNQGNEHSRGSEISADGRYVAFRSGASNLVPGDTNGAPDLFVHDRQTSVTERVSVDSVGNEANHSSEGASLSPDGRYVAFLSYASNLVAGDTNSVSDVFVHDRQTGVTERVSVDSAGNQGNGYGASSSISAGGRYVAFGSLAANLVPGDTNGAYDIFVHDRQTSVTERVSVDSAGNQGNGHSYSPSISADGRYVAFHSYAPNLVPADTNGAGDVFVHDRGTTDSDGDTVPDDTDNCPDEYNPPEDCDDNPATPDEQCDTDVDGVGDACDNCPLVSDPDQSDSDGDNFGNLCDCDDDNGGTPDNQESRDGTDPSNPADDLPLDTDDSDSDGALNWEEDWCGTDPFDSCGDDCQEDPPYGTHDAWLFDINIDCWVNTSDVLAFSQNIAMPAELGVEPTYQCRFDLNGDEWINSSDILLFPQRVAMPYDCRW